MFTVKKLFPTAYASQQMCCSSDLPERDEAKCCAVPTQLLNLCEEDDKIQQCTTNNRPSCDSNQQFRKRCTRNKAFSASFDRCDNIVTFANNENDCAGEGSDNSGTSSVLSQGFCDDILGKSYKRQKKRRVKKKSSTTKFTKSNSDSKIQGNSFIYCTANQSFDLTGSKNCFNSNKLINKSSLSSNKGRLKSNRSTNMSDDCFALIDCKCVDTQTNLDRIENNNRKDIKSPRRSCKCCHNWSKCPPPPNPPKPPKSPINGRISDCLCCRCPNWTECCVQANPKKNNACLCCESDIKTCSNCSENCRNYFEVSSSLLSNIDSNESSQDDELCCGGNNYIENATQTLRIKSRRFGYKNNNYSSSIYHQLFTCTPLKSHHKYRSNNDWDDSISEHSNNSGERCCSSPHSCSNSSYCDLPYQHNEEYTKLVEELEEKLLARNKDRVKKTIQEFESRSRQNQNLEKPIFDDEEDESSDDDPILEKLAGMKSPLKHQKVHSSHRRSNNRGKEKCVRLNEAPMCPPRIIRTNCVYNLPEQPTNRSQFRQTIMKTHWQMDPKSGEWIKEKGIARQNEFCTGEQVHCCEGVPRGCTCKMHSRMC